MVYFIKCQSSNEEPVSNNEVSELDIGNEIDSYEKEQIEDNTLHVESCPGPVDSTCDRDPNTIGNSKKVISGFRYPFYIQITDDGRVYLTEYGSIFELGILHSQWSTNWIICERQLLICHESHQ